MKWVSNIVNFLHQQNPIIVILHENGTVTLVKPDDSLTKIKLQAHDTLTFINLNVQQEDFQQFNRLDEKASEFYINYENKLIQVEYVGEIYILFNQEFYSINEIFNLNDDKSSENEYENVVLSDENLIALNDILQPLDLVKLASFNREETLSLAPKVTVDLQRSLVKTIEIEDDNPNPELPHQLGFIVAKPDFFQTNEDDDVLIIPLNQLFENDNSNSMIHFNDVDMTINGINIVINNETLIYQFADQYQSLSINQIAEDRFHYRVINDNGLIAESTVTIQIKGQNDAPIASDDMVININEDTLTIPINLLLNDSDIDRDELTMTQVTAVHGTVTLNQNLIQYIANSNYSGQDIIQYTITDGHDSFASATVTINVIPVADQPNLNINISPPTQTFPAIVELSDLAMGDENLGRIFKGIDAFDLSGYAVSSAGDINHDGLSDIIIGAYQADPNMPSSGESYVIFGNTQFGLTTAFDLSTILNGNGEFGFVINGAEVGDSLGFSVSGLNDINNDGIDDLILGGFGADANNLYPGEAYVIYGRENNPFPAKIEVSAIDQGDASLGFKLIGVSANDNTGHAVASAGDINNDGVGDLIIGAPSAGPNGINQAGTSYVVFGKADGQFNSSFDLTNLLNGDGSEGFVLQGNDQVDISGLTVGSAGDFNHDGIDDIFIGAPWADPHGEMSGETYIIFGKNGNQFDPVINLSTIASGDGSQGLVIRGESVNDLSGRMVSAAGDVNHDGIDDLIIGALGKDYNGKQNVGAAYVVYGQANFANSVIELSDITNGNGQNGFIVLGENQFDNAGESVANAGDLNQDGIDDFIIGAYHGDPNGNASGLAYVIYGQAQDQFPAIVELSQLNQGQGLSGFIIRGEEAGDLAGHGLSSVADFNGDGLNDLLIGAYGSSVMGQLFTGKSYLLFGQPAEYTHDPIDIMITSSLNDVDGSENLTLLISGFPTGSFFNHGQLLNNDVWQLSLDDLAQLQFNPALNFSGNIKLTINAVAYEIANNDFATTESEINLQVTSEFAEILNFADILSGGPIILDDIQASQPYLTPLKIEELLNTVINPLVE